MLCSLCVRTIFNLKDSLRLVFPVWTPGVWTPGVSYSPLLVLLIPPPLTHSLPPPPELWTPQFFQLFVLPLYSGLTSVLPAMEPLCQQVQLNYQMWLEMEAKH